MLVCTGKLDSFRGGRLPRPHTTLVRGLCRPLGKLWTPKPEGNYEWRPTKKGLFGRLSCWVRSGLRFGAFWRQGCPSRLTRLSVDTPFPRPSARWTLRRTRRRSRRCGIRPKRDRLRGLATRRSSPLLSSHAPPPVSPARAPTSRPLYHCGHPAKKLARLAAPFSKQNKSASSSRLASSRNPARKKARTTVTEQSTEERAHVEQNEEESAQQSRARGTKSARQSRACEPASD